jgi:peptide/nickel transport system substrate-binding protein
MRNHFFSSYDPAIVSDDEAPRVWTRMLIKHSRRTHPALRLANEDDSMIQEAGQCLPGSRHAEAIMSGISCRCQPGSAVVPHRRWRVRLKGAFNSVAVVVLIGTIAGCSTGPSASAPAGGTTTSPDQSAPPRRTLVMAMAREPQALEPALQPQNREWAAIGSAYLTYFTPDSAAPVPFLAAELPSVDDGTMKLMPDGTMQTTYKLKPNATWQDGEPIKAHDFVFGWKTRMDPDMPVHSVVVERKLTNAEALDSHTLLLTWKQPYLWAGAVHLPDFAPLPSHALEELYKTDKASFIDGPQWRDDFLGSGPFRLMSWDRGVGMSFQAYDGFVLGKPGIDDLEIHFVNDTNTVVANLLGGAADVAFSNAIGYPEGVALEQASFDGTVLYMPGNPRIIEFQGRDWGDTIKTVFDVRVRRAALTAIDRQAIVDAVYGGKATVAYFWLAPNDPAYPAVDAVVTKYSYDPKRAEALLQEAGWTKGPDGIARNAAGDPLYLPMINQPAAVDQIEAAIVQSNWKDVGITSEVHRLSPQEHRDNQLRSKFRAVAYTQRGMQLEKMVWTSDAFSTAENRWSGQNRIGYSNPRLDAAWAKVVSTTDPKQRQAFLIEGIGIMEDDAMVTLTHLKAEAFALRKGLVGPTMPTVVDTSRIWNIWAWHWK